ncbi:uncharacterized protein LY89DRAFT_685072 [Mollisia scopiformis]|uniref:Uncharacterized protein n=1 Tax=Mollisia scopiformis TaxID=149040 RepID=A0A194XAC5_MOLSC|nr:uncharacterized protein LY89DRAFT_685072 [Mollisia scopiformis]KUJ17120.1 hypothetical protein LY89DRAFT_685072 [Mollisia scopiformis]
MATSSSNVQLALTTASSLMGIVAVSGGIYGMANPLGFSSTLGIPITSSTSPALPFVSFAAARNLGSGVTMLALLATGQRKAVGTVLLCGTVVAWGDAWVCNSSGGSGDKTVGHAVAGVIAAALGWGMNWVF